jgi:hypothetical protein
MEKHTNVYAAFAAAQAEFKSPAQSGVNPHFNSRYSTLGDIFAATLPALNKHGLVFTQTGHTNETGITLVSRIVHAETTDYIESVLPLPMDPNPQKFGSLLSYLKRYAAAAMFAVVDGMDDDGEAASQGKRTPPQQPQRPQAKRPAAPVAEQVNGSRNDNPFEDDTLDPDALDIINSWSGPADAYAWAIEVAACQNEFEARNSLKKIIETHFDGSLNTANMNAAFRRFYLRQEEKLEAETA